MHFALPSRGAIQGNLYLFKNQNFADFGETTAAGSQTRGWRGITRSALRGIPQRVLLNTKEVSAGGSRGSARAEAWLSAYRTRSSFSTLPSRM